MPLTFLYQSVIWYALLVFLLIKLFYYVYVVFFDKRFRMCWLKYKEQTLPIFSTLTLIGFNTCKIALFPIFSTLTLSRFYLFSALPIFHQWRYKEQTFPIFSTLTLCCLHLFSSMKNKSCFISIFFQL
jgi:hypothetical protein